MMRESGRFHSLLAQFTLRVIVPLSLVLLLVLAIGLYTYQQALTSLLIDRDRQLAALSASQLSEVLAGYARELTGLTADVQFQGESPLTISVPANTPNISQVFTAGLVVVDREGRIVQVLPDKASPVGSTVADQSYFQMACQSLAVTFSDVVVDQHNRGNMVVIVAPIVDATHTFRGALLGAVDLDQTALNGPIERLRIGQGGLAYLVDSQGRVIFHPDHQYIGVDFTDRPFVNNVIAGESGGTLWQSRTTGEQVIIGYAHVNQTGWGLIVREPWAALVGPVQTYGLILGAAVLTAVVLAGFFLWQGVRRIAEPVQQLVTQTGRLAAGETVEPLAAYGIQEIDALDQAFNQMAKQILSYRAGLQRYVEALTQLQEDERRRIARDLHDETVQSLLTISRRLELYQASETDPAQRTRLSELQEMVATTMQEVRQISRDLRPLILEDLGLVPALRTLVRDVRAGDGDLAKVRLEVSGQIENLSVEQELAFYRIAQEALTNIRKHAAARQACVKLCFVEPKVQMEIVDDGRGFSVPKALTELAQQGGFGLVGIQERVWAMGGTFSIQSAIGQGTCLSVSVPVRPPRVN